METLALVGRSALVLAFLTFVGAGLLRLLHREGLDVSAPANRWAHRLLWAGWGLTSAALFLLVGLFVADAFAFTYVSGRSNREMATVYKVTALWAGQEGSLLLWLWIQSSYALLVSHKAMWSRRLDVGAAGVLALIASFFALLVAFVASPFLLNATPPADGAGMNPILQSYWMTAHPVMLYLGYVGLSVPFAYGASSLINRSDAWIRATRRWSLVAWTFLSIGILFGARWAYEELGWGGYWGWDPVENASFMPWLVATAFVHSGLIQEKRGMLKRWNHVLIFATYLLTIFGTFITRSGILSSVHAFVESDISPWFIGFVGLLVAGYLYGLTQRWESLKDERRVDSPLSKESSFLANNVVLLASAFAIFWGTVFPLIASALGRQVTVGAPYFDKVTAPLFWLLIVLMGIGPLIAWRRASPQSLRRHFTAPVINALFMLVWLLVVGLRESVTLFTLPAVVFVFTTILMEFARGVGVRMRSRGEPFWLALPRMMNRSPGRYGGYVVHLGILLLVVGISATGVYQQEQNAVLGVGEEARVGGYTLSLYDVRHTQHGAVPAVEADLLVRDPGGEILGFLRPSKRFYPGSETMGPTTEVAVYGTLRGDVYAVLAGWEPYGSLVGFKLYFTPLVWLIWTGGGLLVFGGLFAFWPRTKRVLSESEHALASMAELEYDFRMGKVNESEYRALFVELSGKAESYLAREAEAIRRVEAELAGASEDAKEQDSSGSQGGDRSDGRGNGAKLLSVALLAGMLSLSLPACVSAQAPAVPPVEGGMPSGMGPGVAVTSDVLVVSAIGPRLSVLNFVNLTNVGEEAVGEIHVPIPKGAILQERQPERLAPAEDGTLVDPEALLPDEDRRYTLRYEIPVMRWPYPFLREIEYPTRELTLLGDTQNLNVSGVDVVQAGQESVAGAVFTTFRSEWIAPGTTWQAVFKPTAALGPLPGWDERIDRLDVIAEADRFPGDWLFQQLVGLPGWLQGAVLILVGAGSVAVLLRRRAAHGSGETDAAPTAGIGPTRAEGTPAGTSAGSDPSGDSGETERDALLRAVARLDIAYSEGALPERGYRRRRLALIERLKKEMPRGT